MPALDPNPTQLHQDHAQGWRQAGRLQAAGDERDQDAGQPGAARRVYQDSQPRGAEEAADGLHTAQAQPEHFPLAAAACHLQRGHRQSELVPEHFPQPRADRAAESKCKQHETECITERSG